MHGFGLEEEDRRGFGEFKHGNRGGRGSTRAGSRYSLADLVCF